MPLDTPKTSLPSFGGRLLDGKRLLLLNCIGAGGYGKVYRALSTTPNKFGCYRAVKCLRRFDSQNHRDEEQQREFHLQSLVHRHPNIVTFHKLLQQKHYVFAVFDYHPGGDLFNAITKRKLYHKNDALISRTLLQLIDAIQFCHDSGVYHRDIKPENVLVGKDGRTVYLSDFGLATRNAVSSSFGVGSSLYMAPEVVSSDLTNGSYAVAPCDIWSLGVIITNLITLRCPWTKAEANNDNFVAYLHDPDYLRWRLPLSRYANQMVKAIFQLNPLARISLKRLRIAVEKTPFFYAPEDELVYFSHVTLLDDSFAINMVPSAPQGLEEATSTAVSCDGSGEDIHEETPLNSDEKFTCLTPDENECPLDHPPLPGTLGAAIAKVTVPSPRCDHRSISEPLSSSPSFNTLDECNESDVSVVDSEGPITPETNPLLVQVEEEGKKRGIDIDVPSLCLGDAEECRVLEETPILRKRSSAPGFVERALA